MKFSQSAVTALLLALTGVAITIAGSGCGGPLLDRRLTAKPPSQPLSTGDYLDAGAEHPGEQIDIHDYTARGKYTIFEFSSRY